MVKLIIANALMTIAAAAAPAVDWNSALAEPCPLCVAAKDERARAPVPIPNRAVVWSFSGEFARGGQWWLIDLDTGQVTQCEWVSGSAAHRMIKQIGVVDPEAQTNVRAAAARLWRSTGSDMVYIAPGAIEDDVVVSGTRMIAFSRADPNNNYIVSAIEAALSSANRTKN